MSYRPPLLNPIGIVVEPLGTPSPLPISLDLIKQHLRIDGAENDSVLQLYELSAITWAENATKRTIYQRSVEWQLQQFPIGSNRQEIIRLPQGLGTEVTEIKYSENGILKTLTGPTSPGSPKPPVQFQEDLGSDAGGLIMPLAGESWPCADSDEIIPVRIAYKAGWIAAEVPQNIIHAILFAISDLFEFTGSMDLKTMGGNLEARYSLISPWILERVY